MDIEIQLQIIHDQLQKLYASLCGAGDHVDCCAAVVNKINAFEIQQSKLQHQLKLKGLLGADSIVIDDT